MVIILIEVNHKICSGSFPIPKYFIKIYLKSTYNQIHIDWLIGWVLWHINPCRLFNAKSIFM